MFINRKKGVEQLLYIITTWFWLKFLFVQFRYIINQWSIIGNLENDQYLKAIKLKIGDRRYVLNADTKRRDVEVFIENEKNENTWSNYETKRVSNASNGKHIENLQMYIV